MLDLHFSLYMLDNVFFCLFYHMIVVAASCSKFSRVALVVCYAVVLLPPIADESV